MGNRILVFERAIRNSRLDPTNETTKLFGVKSTLKAKPSQTTRSRRFSEHTSPPSVSQN